MREWLNQIVDTEDLERHDKWLCMMWPRLQLLKELLADDGVIFVSIDDNEQHHLRMMMDDVWGAASFIANLAVVANLAGSSDQFGFAGAHEHCLVYAKNRNEVNLGRFPVQGNALEEWHRDDTGYYKPELLQRGSLTYSESLDYPIFVGPDGAVHITNDDEEPDIGGPFTTVNPRVRNGEARAIWRWSKARVRENPSDVFAQQRRDGSMAIYSKQRPQLGDLPTEKPKSVFYKAEYSSRAGGQTLSQILYDANERFPYPKAVALMSDLLRIGAPGHNDIVLDSFAGSGTTAHAVLALNQEDGGNRQFILVECEDYADSITAERVRRVINGVPGARDPALREGLGGSFTYCTLGEPIDLEGMLTGEALPSFDQLAAYLVHTVSGISVSRGKLRPQGSDRLFYSSGKNNYHLFYEPDLDYLRSNEATLNQERSHSISKAARAEGKGAIVFAPDKYIGQRELTSMGITFCQLPYEIHTARSR